MQQRESVCPKPLKAQDLTAKLHTGKKEATLSKGKKPQSLVLVQMVINKDQVTNLELSNMNLSFPEPS